MILIMQDRQDFSVGQVRFLGEQDGKPERELKSELCTVFSRYAAVEKAYLARVSYDAQNDPGVALCVVGSPSDTLLGELQNLFHNMFQISEQLDIMFLSREQELELHAVANAFFVRQ